MEKLIENFTNQIKDAISIGEKVVLNDNKKNIKNVLISGMGGSGIGGLIASQIAEDESKIPISINNNYSLPNYIDEESLIIISSYSGNTEETMNALLEAQNKKAKIVCISSGGEIEQFALSNNIDYINIPSGMPPRGALGYSLIQILFIFNYFGIINDSFKNDLSSAIELLDGEEENIKNEAREIANKLYKTFPIIYSSSKFSGIATRFKQQLNENSKMLCHNGQVPEMNHNELVGWENGDEKMSVIFFRNKSDYFKINKRMDISKEIIGKHTNNIIDIYSKGNSKIEEMLYHIHIGDFISLYLGELNNVDIEDIKVIEYLKSSLSNIEN